MKVGECSQCLPQMFYYWIHYDNSPTKILCFCKCGSGSDFVIKKIVLSILPFDSPLGSWLRPTGAAALPHHWSEVGPAPGLRLRVEMRTTLQGKEASNECPVCEKWSRTERFSTAGEGLFENSQAHAAVLIIYLLNCAGCAKLLGFSTKYSLGTWWTTTVCF